MKTSTLFLFFVVAFRLFATAQPTISKNEFYYVGDIIRMANCDATNVNAGASGAGVMWDFSGLRPTGVYSITTIAKDNSSIFITSNLLETLPGD